MKPAIKKTIIAIVTFALLAGAYIFFFKKPAAPALVGSAGVPVSATSSGAEVGSEFLNLLLSVRNIKLEDSVFSKGAFISLQDYTINLQPEGNEGRINPFAPIGVEGAPSNTTSTVTITTGS